MIQGSGSGGFRYWLQAIDGFALGNAASLRFESPVFAPLPLQSEPNSWILKVLITCLHSGFVRRMVSVKRNRLSTAHTL